MSEGPDARDCSENHELLSVARTIAFLRHELGLLDSDAAAAQLYRALTEALVQIYGL